MPREIDVVSIPKNFYVHLKKFCSKISKYLKKKKEIDGKAFEETQKAGQNLTLKYGLTLKGESCYV